MMDNIQNNTTGTIFPNPAEVNLYEGRFISSGEVPNVPASRITGKFLTFMTQLLERVCIAGNGKIHTNNTDSMQLINAIQTVANKAADNAAKKAVDNALPIGSILDFDGTVADVPQGWAICDGRKYIMSDQSEVLTPDLRNKFIMGSDEASLRTTGGANEYSLTVAQMPAHNHYVSCHNSGSGSVEGILFNRGNRRVSGNFSFSGTSRDGFGPNNEDHLQLDNRGELDVYMSGLTLNVHNHGITIGHAGSNAKIDNKPAYYAVIKIRRYE